MSRQAHDTRRRGAPQVTPSIIKHRYLLDKNMAFQEK
jgi:hypothetical protein